MNDVDVFILPRVFVSLRAVVV